MDVVLKTGNIATRPAGMIALGVLEGTRQLTGAAAAVDSATGGAITSLLQSGDFRGRPLEIALLYPKGTRARRVLVLGLGTPEALTLHRVRQVAGLAARRARELGAKTLATIVHGGERGGLDPAAAAQAVAEGSVLGHYRFAAYRSDPGTSALDRVEIFAPDAASARTLKPAVELGARWAEAACLARDLAATPGQDLTPEGLAARAREIARASGATAKVFGVPELERLGMGAVLAVGRGSVHPPRFIVLERAPDAKPRGGPVETIVLIGKGVTFDTGGISLKPRENMAKMKYDMAGAAAVLGVFAALPTLDLPFRVIGLIPSAENMPGGRAFKPGDVLRALDGTTIEVTNTDAEGRLLLADALAYARRYEPAAVVNLATLTGAITIALGNLAAGLFANDEGLAAEMIEASTSTHERVWRMPLWDDYRPEMKSDVADLVNSAGVPQGGAILAAVFLAHFARGLKWAHLDIASTGWAPADRPYEPKGPTGFGVRLLLDWLRRRAAIRASSAPASRAHAARDAGARTGARPSSRKPAARGGASGRASKSTGRTRRPRK